MRIGICGSIAGPDGLRQLPLPQLVEDARQAETAGFAVYALANEANHDALCAFTAIGGQTRRIELLTTVVPIYGRHPRSMAQQALTVQSASAGRFNLGIGISHQWFVERTWGLAFDRPIAHMREYLSIVLPLLRGEPVDHSGSFYRVQTELNVPEAAPTECLLAANGPMMLRLAGEMASGIVPDLVGPNALGNHIIPRVTRAAEAAGGTPPRIANLGWTVLTSDAAGTREEIPPGLKAFFNLPFARTRLEMEGASDLSAVLNIGDEQALDNRLKQYAELGVTDYIGCLIDIGAGAIRTREYLQCRIGLYS